ncbi:MAG: hypothetical protein NXI32_19150 [bacterium]|nr:hypothetical protein [bacterium]
MQECKRDPVDLPEPLHKVEEIARSWQTSIEHVLAEIHGGELKAVNIGKGQKRPRWRIPASEAAKYLLRKTYRG